MNFNSLIEKEIKQVSQWTYEYLKNNLKEEQFKIFQPRPSPIDKIQNRIRFRIIIKGNMTGQANEVLNRYLKEIYSKNLKTTRITIDVNPNNMM